ncbi:MAG: DUF2334 domain-containing protein [Myxococcota bacterium]
MSDWLPAGKRAAICFTIDDVHPGRARDGYDGGGDLGEGALGLVQRLLERHPLFKVTLFTTPDWRETTPKATSPLRFVPWVRDRVYLAPMHPPGTMRLSRHPAFVRYLKELPRAEIALHGLHHVHTGPTVLVEFQEQSAETCAAMLRESMRLFDEAGLPFVKGMTPPGWNAPPGLIEAMAQLGFDFLASARDIKTPVTRDATCNMSGLKGVSLLRPEWIAGGRLLHVPANFQATSPVERALELIECGGLLSIKAHIVKHAHGHVALDGVDALYMNYLDVLLSRLEDRYGDTLWWTTMGELSRECAARRSPPGGDRGAAGQPERR